MRGLPAWLSRTGLLRSEALTLAQARVKDISADWLNVWLEWISYLGNCERLLCETKMNV